MNLSPNAQPLGTRGRVQSEIPLQSALFCLDCEMISNTTTDECPACKNHSLLSLSRILGGSLHQPRFEQGMAEWPKSGSFDIALTVELKGLPANHMNNVIEKLTHALGPKLGGNEAFLRVNVTPVVDGSLNKAA